MRQACSGGTSARAVRSGCACGVVGMIWFRRGVQSPSSWLRTRVTAIRKSRRSEHLKGEGDLSANIIQCSGAGPHRQSRDLPTSWWPLSRRNPSRVSKSAADYVPVDWDAHVGLAGPAGEARMVAILISSAEQDRDRNNEPSDDHGGYEVFLSEHFSRSSVAVWAQSFRNGDRTDAGNGELESFINNLWTDNVAPLPPTGGSTKTFCQSRKADRS